MTTLIANNLTYSYSKESQSVLTNVSIRLNPGTLTALVGPNGAGKSTLLRLLQGQRKPNSGQINVDGRPLAVTRDQVALMPQRGLLNWSFPITVEGLVALGRVKYTRLSFLYNSSDWLKIEKTSTPNNLTLNSVIFLTKSSSDFDENS